jgi:branched-chain amino acid transport system permease protein
VWLILVIWPDWLVHLLGRKKVFVNALLNGVTLGALYFLVASGFTLIFGLMRNVNLAHGSLYLAGAYIGFEVSRFTGSWVLAFPVAFIAMALLGVLLQVFVFRHLDGQDLQQTLITIGISIVLADLMLWKWGGQFYQIYAPDWLSGPVETFIQSSISKRTGEPIYIKYPAVRLFILMCAIFIGLGMWYVLNKSKLGMLIRAGVDDREMLAASGVRIQLIFVGVFAFGAGLAGIAGVVGGTFQSIAPGEDTRFLLSSLVVVIVGGMGSIPGAALGAVLIGCAEQFGSVYAPTYSIVLTFVIMVVVLAFRPQGLLGRN